MKTTPVIGMAGGGMRNQSASVLLPPAQDQEVMIMGGGPPFKPNKTDAIDNVDIVDLKDPNRHFVPASPLNFPRLHLNAVLLPDHTVFVTGGSLKQEDEPLARLQPEIYNPVTDTWTPMAPAMVPRLYHSTALLLPDGSVVAAGGNPEGGSHCNGTRIQMRRCVWKSPARRTVTKARDRRCCRAGAVYPWTDDSDHLPASCEYSVGQPCSKLRDDAFLGW